MDKIRKALQKLLEKEKKSVKNILLQIESNNFKGLDIKKLKGYDNIFRVRKGKVRIIFRNINGDIKILTIEKRSDTIYKF